MSNDQNTKPLVPHVLIFPLPLQGPVNCMLKLAEILCLEYDLKVTFLNTESIQKRLQTLTNIESHFKNYPNFHFETIPDGFEADDPCSGNEVMQMFNSLESFVMPIFRDMLSSSSFGVGSSQPVTCVIAADGIFNFAAHTVKEMCIPLVFFDTLSPCGLWSNLCIPQLIEEGKFPFQGDDLDEVLIKAPGLDGFLRRRDFPSFCRTSKITDRIIELILKEDEQIPVAQGLIFNTFEALEAPILSEMRKICSNVYAIGPLHTHLKTRLAEASTNAASNLTTSNSLWEEDRSCISWLDKQPLKSVIYVSIGSLAIMTKDQVMELWHGLINSGFKFLWVRRPGSIIGLEEEFQVPEELSEGTKERGCIVSWAPQEEVLAHPAIGGFFTHSGWNSTLESIVEGKPMICWPYFVDQQVNSRYVGEFWKLGLDIKDTCDRVTVEKTIKELMEVKKDDFLQKANQMSKLAKESVLKGGSSYRDLDRLIEDIRSMKL